ncbi:MAG: GGDEF domain-containing protein, partial [bacterium]
GIYTIAMIDIDKFKDFNDTYGHDSGDVVLKQVARLLESNASGTVYRFGGEEFTIVYPGYGLEEVEEELEQLRKVIANNKVEVTRKSNRATKLLERKVTVSIGAAEREEDDTAEEVLNRADNALFKAKDEGRNTVVTK